MKINKISYVFLTTLILANVEEDISILNKKIIDGEFQVATDLFARALLNYDSSASLYYVGAQIAIKMDDLDLANKHFVKAIP